MERINRLLRPRRAQSYEPLPEQSEITTQERRRDDDEDGSSSLVRVKRETSTFEYVVFALVGVAM